MVVVQLLLPETYSFQLKKGNNSKEFLYLFQVPIVRKTGGLADTVFDMDDQSHTEIANG